MTGGSVSNVLYSGADTPPYADVEGNIYMALTGGWIGTSIHTNPYMSGNNTCIIYNTTGAEVDESQYTGGIFQRGNDFTVKGNVTFPEDTTFELGENQTLIFEDGLYLTIPSC